MKSVVVLLVFLSSFQQNVDIKVIDSKLFDKINDVRVGNKCQILIRDENLDKAATSQAEYIASKEVLGHVQKENPKTKELMDRVKFFGNNKYTIVGENLLFTSISKNTKDYDSFVEKMKTLWVKSPPHFKNIKNNDYNCTGFGFALNKVKNKIYVVQVFGKK